MSAKLRTDRFLLAAAKALLNQRKLLPAQSWIQVDGCANGPVRENYCHFVADAISLAHPGSKPVAGWCVESVRRGGLHKFAAVFDYHSVVELSDGSLLCPSTPVGESISFLRDDKRPFDISARVAYNLAYFSSEATLQPSGHALRTIAPYTLAWAAPLGNEQIYSTCPIHARWVSFGWSEPFEFAAEARANAQNFIDMCFCSDLDRVLHALGQNVELASLSPERADALLHAVHELHRQGKFRQASVKSVMQPARADTT
jgi:hypothetical protein